MQVDAEDLHEEKGQRQHQRDGQGHHRAGAPAQGEEAHGQDDGDGLGQGLDEQPDRHLHDLGLVGHGMHCDACRQVSFQPAHGRLEILAQVNDIATLVHDHTDADRLLAVDPHARAGRIGETALHLGDVAKTEMFSGHGEVGFANALQRVEGAGDMQAQPVRVGLDKAGSGHCILALERIENLVRRQPQGGEARRGDLDVDFFLLDPDQFQLFYIGHALQFPRHTVRLQAQSSQVKAIAR